MPAVTWATTGSAVGAAFTASLVEVVEAFTIVLAAGTLRGWRPAAFGTVAAIIVLGFLILLLSQVLNRFPLFVLQVLIGTLLLLFGMGWLRKAILRSAGVLPVHDEDEIFVAQAVSLAKAASRQQKSLDWLAGLMAFKAVLLEGLEVVFIVVAVGAGRGLIWPASLGALSACVLILLIGVAVHRPLSRVPENTLQFGVGIMLSAFGVFWVGEGLGVEWPGHDLSLFLLAALFLAAGTGMVKLLGASAQGDRSMTLFRDVISELFAMFLADFRLTFAVLGLVAFTALLISGLGVSSVLAGFILVLGCILILLEAVTSAARLGTKK